MSSRPDGTNRCDRCDRDIGNASILEAATISDLDPDTPGTIRVLHLCRANHCVNRVLTARALAALIASKGA